MYKSRYLVTYQQLASDCLIIYLKDKLRKGHLILLKLLIIGAITICRVAIEHMNVGTTVVFRFDAWQQWQAKFYICEQLQNETN